MLLLVTLSLLDSCLEVKCISGNIGRVRKFSLSATFSCCWWSKIDVLLGINCVSGLSAIFSWNWWSKINVLLGIICVSEASRVALCVFSVAIMTSVFLTSSFSAPPQRFNTSKGEFKIRPFTMFSLWLNFEPSHVSSLLRYLFSKFHGLLDPLSLSSILGWKNIIGFFMILGLLFNTWSGKLFILSLKLSSWSVTLMESILGMLFIISSNFLFKEVFFLLGKVCYANHVN